MSLEWKSCKIGDVVSVRRGSSPRPIKDYVSETGMPWVKIADATKDQTRFINFTSEFIKEEGIEKSVVVNPGDLIVSNSATPGLPKFMNIKACVHDGWLVFDSYNGILKDFLYYYFIVIRGRLVNQANGSVFKNLKTDIVRNFDINLPDLETQEKIVKILSQIDKKIETTIKINKNLEEQIETIYNSFFVYYDDFLKEELEECEIGFIPKDWNLMTLGQITTQIKEKVGKNNYKVFSAVNTGNLILSEEYFDKQVFSKSIEKYIVVKQDEFAYNPARINIGSIGRNDFDYEGCVSPVYVAFKVEEGYENFMNMFIKSKRFNQWVITLSSGSVRQTLNYNDFSIIKIAYPPKSLVNKFNVIYESYYEVINYNKSVIYNLEEIRDTLLPKLMSGEIDVSKINCDLELKYNYMKYLFNQIHTPMSKSVV